MCKAARAESSRFKLHGKAASGGAGRLHCTGNVREGECESRTAMAIEYAISSEIKANVRNTRLVSN